jgi:hypothetical protein
MIKMKKRIKENLFFSNFPTKRLSPFDYVWAIALVILAKIKNQPLVLNLPKEIEQPYELKNGCYLYYQYDKGIAFVNFVEYIIKIAHLPFFWRRKKQLLNLFYSKKENKKIINLA